MSDPEWVSLDELSSVSYPPTIAPHTLELRTAKEIASLPEPLDSDMLLGPLVTRGARTILVGDTGHGKTTLAGQLAVAVLMGAEALGYAGAGSGPVMIVDLEQGLRSIKRYIRELGVEEREDVLYITAPDGLALDTSKAEVQALEAHIDEQRPSVLMLDPYYKAHRGDANDERAVVDLMRSLDRLRAEYEFSLLLPAHPRKEPAGKEGSRRLTLGDVAGSGAVVRGAEVVLGIERLAHGYARLRILKDREGDLPVGEAWPLIFERGEGFRRDPKEQKEREEIENEVVARAADGNLRTVKEWATDVGIRPTKAKEILEAMVESGRLNMVVGPPGRSAKAQCYGTVPELWEQSGTAEPSASDNGTVPTVPDSSIGTVESGNRETEGTDGSVLAGNRGNTYDDDIPF